MSRKALILVLICFHISNAFSQKVVDLGLSVKWTDRNIGANYETESGFFVSWGELSEKHSYYYRDYKYCHEGDLKRLTKYCNNRLLGYYYFKDNKTWLDTEDDIAAQKLGIGYRMPSEYDWKELIDKCEWRFVQYDGVLGAKVIGPNGNSIFLPCDGHMIREEKTLTRWGFYWSRNLNESDCMRAISCEITPVDAERREAKIDKDSFRTFGQHVRAVYIR